MSSIRSRALSILNKEKPDVVPWFGDLSYWIRYLNMSGKMPEQYKGNGMYKLHRDLGVGFYLQGYFPFKTVYDGLEISEENRDGFRIKKVRTPVGDLQEVRQFIKESYCWGPKEYFVKGVNDLKAFRYLIEHTYYEPDYKLAQDSYELIGNNGIVLCYLPKSPFMDMAVLQAGIEIMTELEADETEELEETLKTLEKKHDEAALIALNSPAECLMIPENISSEVVGKRFFEKYMRKYQEKWVSRIAEAGKFSFVHMDGTLKGLIKEVSSTGFSVMEALTPSPVGDIPFEELKDWTTSDSIIWGGLPGVYFTDFVSDNDFDRFVIFLLDIMKRNPRYVLGVADQVPPGASFERIKRVSELVEKYGRYK